MPLGVRRSYRLFFWLILIVSSNLFFSCKDEDCVSIFSNEMRVGFFDVDTLENGDVIVNEKDTVFFAVVADGNDSVFYDLDTLVSILTLPVNPAADMSRFELYMIDSVSRDTLSLDPLAIEIRYYPNPNPHIIDVSYRQFTRVITEDCGVEIGFIDLKVNEVSFPVYEIDSDRLSRFNETTDRVNIEIYF